MMTHQLEVSILAAPLEAIDRRVLSQAWYSALNRLLPAAQSKVGRVAQPRSATPAAAYKRLFPTAPELVRPHLYPTRRLRAVRRARFAGHPAVTRQARLRLAARIEHAFAAPSKPKRATFSLGRGNARVHVVLQATPARTMLVALCRPELRADVSKALAQARTALAVRGIALDVRQVGGRSCS